MKPVVTEDTQRDITQLLEIAGTHYGFDPIGFLGGAIAESGLREHAVREQPWPDVSYGLWQPAVPFLGTEVEGLTRNPNGTVQDTPANRALAKAYCFDAARLADYVGKRYAALLAHYGDPLEAWCRWNLPSRPGTENPNRPAYQNGLARAEGYREDAGTPNSVPQPNFIWKGAHPANFTVGRGGIKPEAVVLHIAEGPLAVVDSWFNDPSSQVSAHFCVGQNGDIHQYVSTSDTAYANGVIEPGYTARLIDDNAGINPNRWTVSIEHEGHSGEVVSDAQWAATLQLTAWLFQNRLLNSGATDVAVDRKHILRHGDISPYSRAHCPGWNEIVIADFIAHVRALLGLPN